MKRSVPKRPKEAEGTNEGNLETLIQSFFRPLMDPIEPYLSPSANSLRS
jgi:hypothetical protein